MSAIAVAATRHTTVEKGHFDAPIDLCNPKILFEWEGGSDMPKASINRRGTTAVDTYVGQKIRDRRTLLGLSQTELANAAGITFQQV